MSNKKGKEAAKKFWNNVSAILLDKKMSWKDLSTKSELPNSSINSSKDNDCSPSVVAASKIAMALGVSIEYLLTGKKYEKFEQKELSDFLSKEEIEYITLWRQLSESAKILNKGLLELAVNTEQQHTEREAELLAKAKKLESELARQKAGSETTTMGVFQIEGENGAKFHHEDDNL